MIYKKHRIFGNVALISHFPISRMLYEIFMNSQTISNNCLRPIAAWGSSILRLGRRVAVGRMPVKHCLQHIDCNVNPGLINQFQGCNMFQSRVHQLSIFQGLLSPIYFKKPWFINPGSTLYNIRHNFRVTFLQLAKRRRDVETTSC